MWIQVRTIDGSQTRTIEDVSRKATIEELRERVWALFDVRPECQRLFYRGKQVRRAHRAPSGSPGRGLQGASKKLGFGGPEGLVRSACREHLASFRVGSPRGSECRPRARRGAAAGPYHLLVEVRPEGSEAGTPRARRLRRSFSAGQQQLAQPARAPGFFRFPPSVGSGAPAGGEGSWLWPPCHGAGGEGRRLQLPAALTWLAAPK